jgi:hypothetical protein
MKCIYILFTLLLLYPSALRAEKQMEIFSTEAKILIATHINIYEYIDSDVVMRLSREASYLNFGKIDGKVRYKYAITSRFPYEGVFTETCMILPEIGDWSVSGYERRGKRDNIWDSEAKLYFHLRCKLYDENTILNFMYSLRTGAQAVVNNGKILSMYNWHIGHYGNRPTVEDLNHFRFSKEEIYHISDGTKEFALLLVHDLGSRKFYKKINSYDDVYILHNYNAEDIQEGNISCFIVPRIFFVALEKESIVVEMNTSIPRFSFNIIVQKFNILDKMKWKYHRLKVEKRDTQHEISITDLGPIPRSEWEPGWPDPATTPLWAEPESECGQCL